MYDDVHDHVVAYVYAWDNVYACDCVSADGCVCFRR